MYASLLPEQSDRTYLEKFQALKYIGILIFYCFNEGFC